MPHNRTLWTLYESRKHGLTTELLTAFRQRAADEGIEAITALVRLMRQYARMPAEATDRTSPPRNSGA